MKAAGKDRMWLSFRASLRGSRLRLDCAHAHRRSLTDRHFIHDVPP
jgi:hypothetical protein